MIQKNERTVCLFRRVDTGKETLGVLIVFNGAEVLRMFAHLEPPWKNNANKVSCIPDGEYLLVPRESEKYGKHLRILNPDGSEILPREVVLIHIGNYFTNTEGCGLVGRSFADINKDGQPDVVSSGNAFAELVSLIDKPTRYVIKSVF